MNTIGIKLADGTFYPILQEGTPDTKTLDLTTAHDNQTTVMVDLYRSETGTMEDAEYVDTLQIDHLVAHPNGEPDLSFNVSLDKDNKLSAEINDPESGEHSDTTITLVSRTLEERMGQTDYSVSQPVEEDVKQPAGGLLAAAAAKKVEDESKPADDAGDFSDLDLPEDLDLTAPADQKENETQDFTEPVAEDTHTDTYEDTLSFAKDALGEDSGKDDFSLPDFSDDVKEPEADDGQKEDSQPAEPEEPASAQADTVQAETVQADTITADEEPLAETPVEEANFDMPDFGTTQTAQEPAPDTSAETVSSDDFSLPDFNEFDTAKTETTDKDTLDDFFNDADTSAKANAYVKDNTPSNGINFDGLYDKETKEGRSSTKYSSETTLKKNTKTPVLICIICALICVIATLLILFVIPSKYNLITMHSASRAEEQAVAAAPMPAEPEEPAQEPAPAPEAKADEVVVAPVAEAVVPEKPAEPVKKPEDTVYKIKWGDTLWDIADAYYKNPWRYHRIAKYNHIKDPDYIISGTTIKLPAE